jgi:hypothetical protein
MSSTLPFHESPRCRARSKRTGQRCQAPAVTGWKVCRVHGAGGGAPTGERNGNYKSGHYTREAIALRRDISALLRQSRHLIEELDPA